MKDLYNVLHKLVSKILAYRLKLIRPGIISLNQNAFVPGRHSILLAYECSRLMKSMKKGLGIYLAVNPDMSKAYDLVELSFVENMMMKSGFAESGLRVPCYRYPR
jgi:hypothetical protein